MKPLAVFLWIFAVVPAHAYVQHSLKLYVISGNGTEMMSTIEEPRGKSLFTIGGGLAYGIYWGRHHSPLAYLMEISLQGQYNLAGFPLFDVLASFSVGGKTSWGYYMAEIFGLGVTFVPLFGARYEKTETGYPFTYSWGNMGTPLNVGFIIILPGFNCRVPEQGFVTLSLRSLINICIYDGTEKTARAIGATAYDHARWDIAFRITLGIGFDFLAFIPDRDQSRI